MNTAAESVATRHSARVETVGTQCDLFLPDGDVLTVYITRHSSGSPPDAGQIQKLHSMIRSLARASGAVAQKAVHDEKGGGEILADAAEDIGYAITLLTQLADGVAEELNVDMQEAQA